MTTNVAEVAGVDADDERRPLMTTGNMAWMNLGFFGVQFSFGLTQSAVNPIFLFLGAEAHSLPILNIAGPITGLLIQPFIGAMSDKTWIPVGKAQAVHPRRRRGHDHHLVPLPAGDRAVDGRDLPVAGGRREQHRHGAVPGVDLRPAAQVADTQGLPDPEHVHRRRGGAGERVAVRLPEAPHRHLRGWHAHLGVRGFLVRCGLRHRHGRPRHAADQGDRADRRGAGAHPVVVQESRRHGCTRSPRP